MSSFEKSVKGGTKIKLAAPKSKYVEHILVATHAGDAGVAEVFRTLQHRLRDSTWTIVFKSLIVVHLMIREGEPNVTLKYLAEQPSKLAISNFSDVQVQGSNIRHYYTYMLARAKSFRDTKLDWVREGQGRLKRQTVEKGLLRETESVQSQIAALLKCDLLSKEPENEISLTAFRLLTMDLLILYHVMNEGTINVLEHYFEMSKYDAERALAIYKIFSKQTNLVVEYLSVARQFEHATRLEIPKLKHAPTSLTSSLEEYLSDPDFEINRRQYLAQQEAKKNGKSLGSSSKDPKDRFKTSSAKASGNSGAASFPEPKAPQQAQPEPSKPEPKGPAPDLIDFFESIEQNQQPMAGQPQMQAPAFQSAPHFQQQQPSAFPVQQDMFNGSVQPQQQQTNGLYGNSNPFGHVASPPTAPQSYTGSGFDSFMQQAQQPQNFQQLQQSQQSFNVAPFPQTSGQQFSPIPFTPQETASNEGSAQSTNPFRTSMMPQSTGSFTTPVSGPQSPISALTRQSTNPFARNTVSQPITQPQPSPFTSPPPNPLQQQQLPGPAPIQQPMRTGTNPFARSATLPISQPPAASPLMPHSTGSTNPFRQSQFVNQQTGQGWQNSQGSMGGLEQMETVPVFPRPGQQPLPSQGQPWPS